MTKNRRVREVNGAAALMAKTNASAALAQTLTKKRPRDGLYWFNLRGDA